jgi:hypothetical protein
MIYLNFKSCKIENIQDHQFNCPLEAKLPDSPDFGLPYFLLSIPPKKNAKKRKIHRFY